MAWERERAEIAAQLIHHRTRPEGIRKSQELDEGGFRPVSQTGLLFGEGAEGLLEAVELELGKTFVGEGIGKAKGEFICQRGKFACLRCFCRVMDTHLSRVGRRELKCPDPWSSVEALWVF